MYGGVTFTTKMEQEMIKLKGIVHILFQIQDNAGYGNFLLLQMVTCIGNIMT